MMLIALGVNTILYKDPEKEARKTENRLFISSSELTSDEMFKRIKQNEAVTAEKQHCVTNKNVFANAFLSLSFSLIISFLFLLL